MHCLTWFHSQSTYVSWVSQPTHYPLFWKIQLSKGSQSREPARASTLMEQLCPALVPPVDKPKHWYLAPTKYSKYKFGSHPQTHRNRRDAWFPAIALTRSYKLACALKPERSFQEINNAKFLYLPSNCHIHNRHGRINTDLPLNLFQNIPFSPSG
jgi:hypothetical protein